MGRLFGPAPIDSKDVYAWKEWYRGVDKLVQRGLVDKIVTSRLDVPTIDHNLLGGHQGGSTAERYHLTQEEASFLGASGTWVPLVGSDASFKRVGAIVVFSIFIPIGTALTTIPLVLPVPTTKAGQASLFDNVSGIKITDYLIDSTGIRTDARTLLANAYLTGTYLV